MATIGRLTVALAANSAQLAQDLNKARKNYESWSDRMERRAKHTAKVIGGIAVAATAAFAAAGAAGLVMINRQAAEIDKMYKQASNLRMDLGDFQRLGFIAEQSGNSVGELSSALQRMNQSLAQGTQQTADALAGIGLSINQVMQMRPDQRFEAIAKAIASTGDEAAATRAQIALFGRSGGNMLNLLSADFEGLNAQFERMGITLTNAQGEMVAAYQDAKNRLSTMFNGFKQQFTAQMAGPLTQIIEWVEEYAKKMGGMDVIAARAAGGVINALSYIVESGADILTFLNDAIIGFKELQLLDAKFRMGQVDIARTLGFKVDNTVFAEARKLEADIAQLRERSEKVDGGAARLRELSQTLLDSIGKELPAASDIAEKGLTDLGETANDAASQINKMFMGGNNAWDKIFGSQAKEGKQRDYIPESFADSARKFAAAMDRNDTRSMEVFARDMQRLIETSRGNGTDFTGRIAAQGDTMGMIDVMNRLLDQSAQNQKVTVDMNLTTDRGQLKGEIIASPEMARAMQEIAKRTVNDTARQVLA
jgi:hypothetical protein